MPPRASSGGGSNASSGAGCPSEQYELREQIGRGAFGTVHLALHKPTRRTYVLKRVRLAKQTGWQRGSALQERALVARLAHPFIVPHIDSWVTGGHTVNIVYGYCEKGDLASLLAKRNGVPLPEATLRLWLAQVLLALDYLQGQQVLHRDIKTANLFLTAAGDVHLGDFGLATRRNGGGGGGASGGDDDGEGGGGGALPGGAEDGSLVGTPHNMSPELLAQRGYGFASDVWSLGCAFYELTAGRPAFNAFNLQGLVSKIRRGRAPPLPAGYSADWTEAVMLMLRKDPEHRPTVQQLLSLAHLRADVEAARARALQLDPAVALPPLPAPWRPAPGGGASEGGGGSSGGGDSSEDAAATASPQPQPRVLMFDGEAIPPPGKPARLSLGGAMGGRAGGGCAAEEPAPTIAIKASSSIDEIWPATTAAAAGAGGGADDWLLRASDGGASGGGMLLQPAGSGSPLVGESAAAATGASAQKQSPAAGTTAAPRSAVCRSASARPSPLASAPVASAAATAAARRSVSAREQIIRTQAAAPSPILKRPSSSAALRTTGTTVDLASGPLAMCGAASIAVGARDAGLLRSRAGAGAGACAFGSSVSRSSLAGSMAGVPGRALAAAARITGGGGGAPGSEGDRHQLAHLKKVTALAGALYAKGRVAELGRLLASPGVAPPALAHALLAASAARAAADAPAGDDNGSSSSSLCGGVRLGDAVVLGSKGTRGVVRWIGPVAFDRAEVDYVGVALERPTGRYGGTVSGIAYFDAAPQHAEFVRASALRTSYAAE